jgi:hypothetical protein
MAAIGIPADHLPAILLWLAVTVVAGGLGTWACGRALAHAWRPFRRTLFYVALLAAAVDFLCFVLFQVPVISLRFLADRAAARDVAAVMLGLSGFVATYVILLPFAYAAWRLTRSRQMFRQYPFLFGGNLPAPDADGR